MLSIHRILHPTDFSPESRCAFQLACALARDYGTPLVLAHVAVPVPEAARFGLAIPSESDLRRLRERLEALRPPDPSYGVERRLEVGDPVTAILEVASAAGCDLIVMGTHGRSGMGRLVMGSVAEHVSRAARCPVLTVKDPRASEATWAPDGRATVAAT